MSEARIRLDSADKLLAQIRPTKVLRAMSERLDWLEGRLVGFSRRLVLERKDNLLALESRLKRGLNSGDLERQRVLLSAISKRLRVAVVRELGVASERVEGTAKRLYAVNPEGVLARGYAIVFSSGRGIRSVSDVSKGDLIRVRVADGEISGEVI
jgi:exodeoxyribonuclease VII large subunit